MRHPKLPVQGHSDRTPLAQTFKMIYNAADELTRLRKVDQVAVVSNNPNESSEAIFSDFRNYQYTQQHDCTLLDPSNVALTLLCAL